MYQIFSIILDSNKILRKRLLWEPRYIFQINLFIHNIVNLHNYNNNIINFYNTFNIVIHE